MRNPFESTGVLVRRRASGHARFGGTCFAFKSGRIFLTAKHNLCGTQADDLGVALFLKQDLSGDEGLDVKEIHEHPAADLAVIVLKPYGFQVFDPFQGFAGRASLGDAVRCFGFPSDSTPTGQGLVPRMLRGFVQRQLEFNSHKGYCYDALELSLPAPAGMSGAPVSPESQQSHIVGLVAENMDSSTLLHQVTEVQTDGSRLTERVERVVTYGIAVELIHYDDWIQVRVDSNRDA
jgi:hypothetical protein